MSPSHTNKAGVRYRYYVSQALLQSKVQGAGSIGRVPTAEIEVLVLAALRHHLQASGAEPRASRTATAFLFIRHLIDASCISPSGIGDAKQIGSGGDATSPLCDAWVCVKPRLALPALRGFRYGIPVLGFFRSHTLYHCYGVARSPHDGLSASNRVVGSRTDIENWRPQNSCGKLVGCHQKFRKLRLRDSASSR